MKTIIFAVIVSGFLSGCGKTEESSTTVEYQTHGNYDTGEKQFVAEGTAPAISTDTYADPTQPAADADKPAEETTQNDDEQKPEEQTSTQTDDEEKKPDCVEISGKKYCSVDDEQQ